MNDGLDNDASDDLRNNGPGDDGGVEGPMKRGPSNDEGQRSSNLLIMMKTILLAVAMQVWRAATMLGLNLVGGFNEYDLNQQCRRMALLLHPDAAVRNGIS